jgi:hypothetical protein
LVKKAIRSLDDIFNEFQEKQKKTNTPDLSSYSGSNIGTLRKIESDEAALPKLPAPTQTIRAKKETLPQKVKRVGGSLLVGAGEGTGIPDLGEWIFRQSVENEVKKGMMRPEVAAEQLRPVSDAEAMPMLGLRGTKGESAARTVGELGGALLPIVGIESGVARALPKAPRLARLGLSGGAYEGGKSALEGDPLPEVAKKTAIGTALWPAMDLGLGLAAKGVKAGVGKLLPKRAPIEPPPLPEAKPAYVYDRFGRKTELPRANTAELEGKSIFPEIETPVDRYLPTAQQEATIQFNKTLEGLKPTIEPLAAKPVIKTEADQVNLIFDFFEGKVSKGEIRRMPRVDKEELTSEILANWQKPNLWNVAKEEAAKRGINLDELQRMAVNPEYAERGVTAGVLRTPRPRAAEDFTAAGLELPKAKDKMPKAELPKAAKLPEGMRARSLEIPGKMQPVGDGTKTRSLPVSVMENPKTPGETRAGLLMEAEQGGAGTYEAITNKATIEEAQKIVALGENEAKRFIADNPGTATSNTVALQLVEKANAEGRYGDAVDIILEVAERSTTQGQAIQALRLWSKLTPQGMQKHYITTIEKANKEISKAGKLGKKLNVSDETMRFIDEEMKRISDMADGREKDVAISKVLDRIASEVPMSIWKKIATIQTMAQLLNPKTAIRNLGGNTMFGLLENVSDVVGTAIDAPLGLLTKRRSKVLPSIGTQLKGGKAGFKLGLEDALLGIDTSAMKGTKFDLPSGRVFRGKVMGGLEKALNIELRATDRAFYQAAYDESLRQQMKAAGKDVADEAMHEIAHHDALYRTFQDENALSNLFVGLKRLLNKPTGGDFGLGDFVLKYPKTPANLLARGLEYSPAGFFKVIAESSKPLMGRGFNQKAFVEAFSRSLVGTAGLVGTGALLHKVGIITGKPHPDFDIAELHREVGFGEYRLNVDALKRFMMGGFNPNDAKPQKGDRIVSYDWNQPSAISLAMGADIDANRGQAKGITGTLMKSVGDIPSELLNAVFTGINTMAEQPVMQGVQTLVSGGEQDAARGILKTMAGVPSSFIPTVLSQIKQLVDNQRRETYDPNIVQESLNRAANKIPGMAGKLPQKYGVLGQPLETYQGGTNQWWNVFLNPAFVSKYTPSPEAQLAIDVFINTGETSQVPRVVDKYFMVGGKKVTLTGAERAELQRIVGEETQKGFSKINPEFDDQAKLKKMGDALTKAGQKGRQAILQGRGIRSNIVTDTLVLPNTTTLKVNKQDLLFLP